MLAGCKKEKNEVRNVFESLPLPALSKNGTPAHRSFSMYPTAAQKVTHRESLGTSSSSLKAGFSPSVDLPYWPIMVLTCSMGSTQSKTRA